MSCHSIWMATALCVTSSSLLLLVVLLAESSWVLVPGASIREWKSCPSLVSRPVLLGFSRRTLPSLSVCVAPLPS